MKRKKIRLLPLLLALGLLLGAVPVNADTGAQRFSDVDPAAWYAPYIDKIIWAQEQMHTDRIITGCGDGTFAPEREVTRGEWMKMLIEAETLTGSTAPASSTGGYAHWAARYYVFAGENNLLVDDVYASMASSGSTSATREMFGNLKDYSTQSAKDTALNAALDTPVTRYEMAVILNNTCTNIARQKTVKVTEPEAHIADYDAVPQKYQTAVEQTYGKGLLIGDENGNFHGDDTLTRAEAVTVLYRYLFQDTINGDGLQEWAEYPKVEAHNYLDPSLSFANWLRNGHVDAWGNIDAEAKTKLFGSPYKSYFVSAYDAAPYVTTVSVPIWTMDAAGQKYPSTCAITVNKAVAEEVKSIFQMIYDDPEQFPIYGGWSAGGARYTDTMRHSWGCAIDVNAYYNCECNTRSGYLRVTCGYGWWPIGHDNGFFAGSMSGQSAYSIGKTPNEYGYSVVKAFATYGWGWGGNGWNGGTSFDYMHFSVLPSGG